MKKKQYTAPEISLFVSKIPVLCTAVKNSPSDADQETKERESEIEEEEPNAWDTGSLW